jgi:hypothetical protein
MRASRRWESFQGAPAGLTSWAIAIFGDDLQPRIARALLQLAQIGAVDGRGCSEVDGLGSFWLTGRQAQTRQEELAVFGPEIICASRRHHRGHRAEPLDQISGLGKPAHMGIAGG